MKVNIIGCGDIGRRVALLLMEQGADVSALVRSDEKAESLKLSGVTPTVANLDQPQTLSGLDVAGAVVFYFAPPPGGGFSDTRVRNFCSHLSSSPVPAKIIYLSTTGVYGDYGDQVVDESTPTNPLTSRGKRRLDAEETFRSFCSTKGIPLVILRVTGIYGPGRLPLSQLRSGVPIIRESECPVTNRIHSEDLSNICIAAAEIGQDGDIYNVSDGHPTTMSHYFIAVADALGLPQPHQISREEAGRVLPPLMLSYFSESRVIDNRKMLENLGVTLRYPTLEEGLRTGIEVSS